MPATSRGKSQMTETPDTLLEALHHKLHELSFMEMSADARAKVAELLSLTAPPRDAGDADIHRPTFDGLIRLAGPVVAPELLAQLGNDLGMIEEGLAQALAAQDIPSIRHQTHVLIALAGSVGAEGLLQLAKSLNAQANLPQKTDMTVLGHRLLFCTTQVRAFVLRQMAAIDLPKGADALHDKGVSTE
jgi:HPt (histidine-containing phosphotransfer) domain-containing protein